MLPGPYSDALQPSVTCFPNSLIYLYFFIPIKAKWFVIIYAAIELWLGVNNSAGDNVAHWAHLGGALVGFLLVFTGIKGIGATFIKNRFVNS